MRRACSFGAVTRATAARAAGAFWLRAYGLTPHGRAPVTDTPPPHDRMVTKPHPHPPKCVLETLLATCACAPYTCCVCPLPATSAPFGPRHWQLVDIGLFLEGEHLGAKGVKVAVEMAERPAEGGDPRASALRRTRKRVLEVSSLHRAATPPPCPFPAHARRYVQASWGLDLHFGGWSAGVQVAFRGWTVV